jgi:hypothetical protein
VSANVEFRASYKKVWEWLMNPDSDLFPMLGFLCTSIPFSMSVISSPKGKSRPL